MRIVRTVTVATALAAGICVAGTTSEAKSFYAFGDSLTDPLFNFSGSRERFTFNNEDNWADYFADGIGATYQVNRDYNYAQGGALSKTGTAFRFLGLPGLETQVTNFLNNSAVTPEDDDVAGIWIGTNDIWAHAIPDGRAPWNRSPLQQPLGPQPATADLASWTAGNVENAIMRLVDAGVKTFMVLTPFDIAEYREIPNEYDALLTEYSLAVGEAIKNLTVEGATTHFLDVFDLLEEVQDDPAAFGYEYTSADNNCIVNSCGALTEEERSKYVFYDGIHVMSSFHELVAERAIGVLNAPANSPTPDMAAVPVPAPILLMLAGLGSLAMVRRRTV